ncbi:hypothetical protein VHEMI10275 [[Torrubiella] hemipterigena]|uniref:N-acetylgalactosaminide beta-1,3-galactosyltransferase n=1 Tax=[Torrubiella] hemipterigena TaxID=1531966 RepID=A0A0A1TT20_9HYPO|nr:hypothetical protein VHEMI10275 [[Torrubiella] hemipterigena]
MGVWGVLEKSSRLGLRHLNQRRNRVAAVVFFVILFSLFQSTTLIDRRKVELPQIPYAEAKPEDFTPATQTSKFNPVVLNGGQKTTKELCDTFPRHIARRIQPVLRIGHADVGGATLKGQFESSSACFTSSELLVFSDWEDEVYGHKSIDVLARVSSWYYNSKRFRHWKIYDAMKAADAKGQLAKAMKEKRFDGWKIDKFKFLPSIEQAWKLKPNKDFYVFYETDTYVFWDNMYRYLETLDPDSKIYMGSPSPGRRDPHRKGQKIWFANGGPGYILSRGAMKALLGGRTSMVRNPISSKYSQLLNDDECCGDSVLGWVLWEAGVQLQGIWPMFTPYSANEIPYIEKVWCYPILTLHKTIPEDMGDLFNWEFANRNESRPLLYSDTWDFYKPGSVARKPNWFGGHRGHFDPKKGVKVKSADECQAACISEERCLQWTWQDLGFQRCILMDIIVYGNDAPEAVEKHGFFKKRVNYTTGWIQDRNKRVRDGLTCGPAKWTGPSMTRIY